MDVHDRQGPRAQRMMTLRYPYETTSDAIRPFRIDVPQEELVELRRRILAIRWPERETVTDESQGVPLTMIQELARYWGTDYDWRKCEAKLNALPQFMTEIDGLNIHFIHVRSKHENALPLIVTHGWPGSAPRGRISGSGRGNSPKPRWVARLSGLFSSTSRPRQNTEPSCDTSGCCATCPPRSVNTSNFHTPTRAVGFDVAALQ
jgi:hypothetical protein